MPSKLGLSSCFRGLVTRLSGSRGNVDPAITMESRLVMVEAVGGLVGFLALREVG